MNLVTLAPKIHILGHMHLRGCYDWFRRPQTEYEKWMEQHERKKARREGKEAKRQKKEEDKLRRYREEMERRREEIRRQGIETAFAFIQLNVI